MIYLPWNEFNKLKDIIYSETGISMNESKIDFLARRIAGRMKSLEIANIKDYLRYLSFDATGRELENLILVIVNHESYFFREYPQLEFFVEQVIPVVEREKKQKKTLSVLSAGCSTGDEPYTLAIILREMLKDFQSWDVRIDGVDISRLALEKAKKGEYLSRSLRDTPYVYRDRYFEKRGDVYSLVPDVRIMVNFVCANIFNPGDVSSLSCYDIVFLRNVLIYFDYSSGRQVLEQLHGRMNRGAFLFLGQAESVARFTSLFEMERLDRMFIYRK